MDFLFRNVGFTIGERLHAEGWKRDYYQDSMAYCPETRIVAVSYGITIVITQQSAKPLAAIHLTLSIRTEVRFNDFVV